MFMNDLKIRMIQTKVQISEVSLTTVGFFVWCFGCFFKGHTLSSVLQHYLGKSGQEIVFHIFGFSRLNMSISAEFI